MEGYLAAKLRLFAEVVEPGGAAVVWADDDYSPAVIAAAKTRDVRLLTVGTPGETLRLVSRAPTRSEEHTSELQSLMRISFALFCFDIHTTAGPIHLYQPNASGTDNSMTHNYTRAS